jgi:polyhydroxybutyrate depolymerase
MRWIGALVVLAACGSDEASNPDGGGGGDGAPDDGATIDGPASSACGGPAGPTGAMPGTITVGGTARTYVRFVPPGYDSSRAYPLIFAWHGRGGNGNNARLYFGIEAAAAGEAIIVYPDGLPVTSNPADTGWELGAAGRDVALFDALQAELASTYCIGRTYSMGHSFGGYMSNALACHRGGSAPTAVRAIAPFAGGGPFGNCAGDPVSAVIMHGIEDMIVLFTEGEASRNTWRTEAGCEMTSQPIDPSPCVVYDGCDGGLTVRFCAHGDTSNAGHGWQPFAAPAAWALFQASP